MLVNITDQSSTSGTTLNLCAARATSLEDLLDVMGQLAGYQIEVIVDPALVRPSEVWRLTGSNSRLIEHDCWIEPSSLNTVLENMMTEYRFQGAPA